MFRINKKIDWLRQKNLKLSKSKIRPISYVISNDTNDYPSNIQLVEYLIVDKFSHNIQSKFERIDIDPDNFNEAPPLDTLYEKWFINLSGIDIPLEVRYLLQLGCNIWASYQ